MARDLRRAAVTAAAVVAAVLSSASLTAASAVAGPRAPVTARASGGTWGTAKAVPGIAALNKGGVSDVNSVSCGSAGNCSLGGYYTSASGNWEAFVASEKNGTWGAAKEVAGSLSKGEFTLVYSVSCGAAGYCTAAGYYTGTTGVEPFVADEVNGT
jgi:hypothetical protein